MTGNFKKGRWIGNLLALVFIISVGFICLTGYTQNKNKDANPTDINNASKQSDADITEPETSNGVSAEQEEDNSGTSAAKPDSSETEHSIIPNNTSEPFVGRINLDSETEKGFYGTWKVEKLLGFANSYNDASEYPTGQKIIGDEIIINKDIFSSKGLENYNDYQYELESPLYDIITICYNEDSFYRLFKIDILGLNTNDEVKHIGVSGPSQEIGIPVSFLIINNDKLILLLEATCFELKKVAD